MRLPAEQNTGDIVGQGAHSSSCWRGVRWSGIRRRLFWWREVKAVDVCRGNVQSGGGGADVQALVPDGDDEVWVGEGQGTGQVDGVGATQGVGAGELPGVAFHGRGQLNWPDCGPVLLPSLLGRVQVILAQVVIPAGRGQRCADFWVGEPTGQGGVASIP